MASEDDEYFLPPEKQRPFSSGIRRKRVQFVRSSDLDTTTAATPSSSSSATSIADKYLSIVMKQPAPSTSSSTPTQLTQSPPIRTQSAPPIADAIAPPVPEPTPSQNHDFCEICNLPIAPPNQTGSAISTDQKPHPHEASLAHQLCLKHSHPPSHLDRTRAGLRYLSTYGWDPDSRLGLGAAGREGIREPIKPRLKNDTAGLGTGLDRDGDALPPRPPPMKVQKLNAKQVRTKIADDKKRAERIRKTFYQNDEVLEYLGEGA